MKYRVNKTKDNLKCFLYISLTLWPRGIKFVGNIGRPILRLFGKYCLIRSITDKVIGIFMIIPSNLEVFNKKELKRTTQNVIFIFL